MISYEKIGKGDPAPYDGILITHHEYNKILKKKIIQLGK